MNDSHASGPSPFRSRGARITTMDDQLFLVERYWPGVTREALDRALMRVRREAAVLTDAGQHVHHVGSVLMTADETVFCLFRAASRASVMLANERAAFHCDRIGEGTWIGGPGSQTGAPAILP